MSDVSDADGDSDRSMSAVREVEDGIRAPRDATLVRSVGFALILEHDEPISRESWAGACDIDVETLDAILERGDTRGRVRLDEEGRLLGIAGLSNERTRHEIVIEGVTRWTWCALDAVGILGALGVDGEIASLDVRSGDAIHIGFSSGIPDATAAVIFILGGYEGGTAVEEWCPSVNFFENEENACEWVAGEGLEGDIVSVTAFASKAADMWRPVVGRNDDGRLAR